jgi:hypothetical protein
MLLRGVGFFRKDQVTRRGLPARRATFDNRRLAAEQVFAFMVARAEIQDRGSEHEQALNFHPNKPPDYRGELEWGLQKGELAVLLKGAAR